MENAIINTCQNCGIALRRLSDFGTHADGSVNTDYCDHCYRDGKLLKRRTRTKVFGEKGNEVVGRIGKSRMKTKELAKIIVPRFRRLKKRPILKSKLSH